MRSGDAVAVRGTASVVLLDEPRGRPVPWPEEYRVRLATAGPQAPELLKVEGS